jgi:Tfp pilus assembly protein PilE
MRTGDFPSLNSIRGFALVELMVITVIIGLIALMATPAISIYRDKSRVASGLGSAKAIQAAFAAYSTTRVGDLYPSTITSYNELMSIVNANGTTLKSSSEDMGLLFESYQAIDSDKNGEPESYEMILRVSGVATAQLGWCLLIQPSGVEKCAAR